jgi:hypothetical protein
MVKHKRSENNNAREYKTISRRHKQNPFHQELYVAGKTSHIPSAVEVQPVKQICDEFLSSIIQVECGTSFTVFRTGTILFKLKNKLINAFTCLAMDMRNHIVWKDLMD